MKDESILKIGTQPDNINKTVKKSKYYKKLGAEKVQCTLCPRVCKIKKDDVGFCKVRKNIDGQLYNLNYGISTYMVVEPIENNAVFHFYPSENALAVGTISCNLDCSFCQAWRYSKITNVEDLNLNCFDHYTPQQIVNKAKKLDLKVISWTFNDPMSWFEFVLDTAKLAKESGIISLFKSNHYVNEKPLIDLAQYVDIFSISIKSIDNEFYQKYCQGSLEPVLHAAKTLKKRNKHIEICNLIIPTLNNREEQISRLIYWVKEHLGTDIPLHFARFHPSYKLTNVPRTSLSDVTIARKIAKDKGFKHVYIGNVFIDDGLNSYCVKCSRLLLSRIGERTTIKNENLELCDECQTPHQIKFSKRKRNNEFIIDKKGDSIIEYPWKEDIWSIHIQVFNFTNETQDLLILNKFRDHRKNDIPLIEKIKVLPNEKLRHSFHRINEDHEETTIYFDEPVRVQIFENLDRAYYSLEEHKGYELGRNHGIFH
jgi:pyruvate formate lyase activating enzyme